MARIPYTDRDSIPPEYRDLLDSSLQDRTSLNIYRAFGNNPPVLAGLRAFLGSLWDETGLTPTEREIVILGVARALDARYEWHQHVRIARDSGVSGETIRAIAADRPGDLEPDHEALVRYARHVVRGTVDDDRHAAIVELYDHRTVVGIAALAGAYLLVARLLSAFDVETEEPFVGWSPGGGD